MHIPLSGSSGEGEPMIVECHTLYDEDLASFKHLHDQITSLETQMYDPGTGCVYENRKEFPVGADPFYDLTVHLSRIFSESIEEGCDHEQEQRSLCIR